MNRRYLIAIAALVGIAMFSNLTWLKRRQERAVLQDRIAEYRGDASDERYIDIGVELRVVIADGTGRELIPGKPLLRVLRAHALGGMLDTRSTPPRIDGPSLNPTVWYCSEDQEPVILHLEELPLGLLVYGSEGAGKTAVMPKWHYCRWLEHIGEDRTGGQTAPTRRRLNMFLDALVADFPATWYTHRATSGLLELCDGSRIEMVSTHKQSAEAGSPIQGQNWSWAGGDEFQDSFTEANNIESRGRAAKNGRYKQLRTCTPKDLSAWREHKDKLIAARDDADTPLWQLRKLLGPRSPFIPSSFWRSKAAIYSQREYERRVDPLKDHLPELAVFYGWERERNLVVRPRIGAIDVTAAILSSYRSYVQPGARFTLLGCHDPGNIFNTTEFCSLRMIGRIPTWMVVGEVQTKQTTARQHAATVREYLRAKFGLEKTPQCANCYTVLLPTARICHRCNAPRVAEPSDKAAIFVDPHGKGDSKTDYETVYMAMQAEGLDVFSPASETQIIKRSARIGMLNRLMGTADGAVRLVVARDDDGNTLAPALVDAFESLVKRPGDDDPEGFRRKDEYDKTHAPAALGYGLWSFEQESLTAETIRRAREAAARVRA